MYIYIIQCGDTPMYKVGVTSGLSRRLENLQTGCPYQLQYTFIVHCKSKHIAFSMETTLHCRLKPYHVRGEWFNLSTQWLYDTIDILRRVGKVVYTGTQTYINEERYGIPQ